MFKHEKQPVQDQGGKISTYLPKLADVAIKKKQENNSRQKKSSRKAPLDQKKGTFLSRQLSRKKAPEQPKKTSFLNRVGQKGEPAPKKNGIKFGKKPEPQKKKSLLPQVASLVNKKQEPVNSQRGGFLNRLSSIGAH